MCGMTFVLDQNERNTFKSLPWLGDRLTLWEISVLSA